MKLITLRTEKDFKKLRYVPFNRSYYVRNDLIQNMNNFGFTVPIILVKIHLFNGKTQIYVLDGQHRCATAQYLNIAVSAILYTQEELHIETMEDLVKFISSLNAASKPWTLIDYANVYNYLNYEEYKKLLKVTNSSPYQISTISTMLYGFRSKGGGINHKIKDGSFKCNLYKETLYTLNLASSLSKYEKLTSRMILALHYVASLKSFDEKKFVKVYKEKCLEVKELKLDNYTDIFSSWIK